MKQREGYRFVILEPAKTRIANEQCPSCAKPKAEWKRRKDWTCCSKECTKDFSEHYQYWGWPDLREKTFKRDNYTCQHCGFVAKRTHSLYDDAPNKKSLVIFDNNRSSQLIGDHIEPIALGGEEWDIDNVQTLCIPCNKIKTRNDAKLIAIRRKQEKMLNQGQTMLTDGVHNN